MSPKVTLESPRLILRPHRPEDWERIHEYGRDADFSRFEPWGPNSVEDSKKYVEEMISESESVPRFKFNMAVELKASRELIGGAGLRRESQESAVAGLGWAIHPGFQRQGYASEAAARLIQFGFEKLGLALIYAICDARNEPSFRVMEKCGMKRVGILVRDKEVKNHWRDTLRYEIIAPWALRK